VRASLSFEPGTLRELEAQSNVCPLCVFGFVLGLGGGGGVGLWETQKDLFVKPSELAEVAEFAKALPAECRQVFTLRKVYGYSGREIANRLGIPERAVEEHLIQAVRRCAQAAPDLQSLDRRPSLLKRLRLRIIHV
jgi:hypothetical protein